MAKLEHYIPRKNVIIIALLIVAIAVATILLWPNGKELGKTDLNKTDIKKSVKSINLSTEPGTYVTIQNERGSVDNIEGLEQCITRSEVNQDISCKLEDVDGSLAFKAPLTMSQNGKSYIFQGWTGCTTSTNSDGNCVIDIAKGANIIVKVLYEEAKVLSSEQSYVQFTVDSITTNSLSNSTLGVRIPSGQTSVPKTFDIKSNGVTLSACTVTDNITLDDAAGTEKTTTYTALATQTINFVDGLHNIVVSCPSSSGNVVASMNIRASDNQPKLCKNFEFSDEASSVTNLTDLKQSIIGQWKGCVTTPWLAPYFVTITFKDDGTYMATADEILDGISTTPMYYGGTQNGSSATYSIKTFQDGYGLGIFNVVFSDGSGSVVSEDMQNIKLMGDKLSFSFKHFNKYGPLVYELKR